MNWMIATSHLGAKAPPAPCVGCIAFALLASATLGCGGPPPPASQALIDDPLAKPTASDEPIRLVVLVVIDQLPSWSFAPLASSFTGGLRRLLDHGVYVPGMQLPYGTPFTAAGHATMGTGVVPAVHGVIGNSWYRHGEERVIDADDDPASPIFRLAPAATESPTLADGASGVQLRVPGLAEALHGATAGRGRAVAIALKARAACFIAGQHPDAVVFFDPDAGGMTTSKAYAPALPAWLRAHAQSAPIDRWRSAQWLPLDTGKLAAVTATIDDAPGEGSEYAMGTHFPYRLAQSSSSRKALTATPFGDRMVLEVARAAVLAHQLGVDEVPDLLAISLNSHDFAGHNWGQFSWEQVDLLWRLDRELGAFLQFLDRRVGSQRYAVVLTSDHGATPLVERGGIPGARRIHPSEIIGVAEEAIDATIGPGDWVASFASSNLYLTAQGRALSAPQRTLALAAAAAAISKVRGIAAVGPYAAILGGRPGQCDRGGALEQAMCMSAAPTARGELYAVPLRGSLITPYRTGTHHDSPFDDNRVVPMVVMVPGVAARIETSNWSNLSVAPTVAALLRVPAPAAATAPALELRRSQLPR
jgi:Type I phosphodiesterase / nucleotide pyrophosphatase